jgi:hypothetical protein
MKTKVPAWILLPQATHHEQFHPLSRPRFSKTRLILAFAIAALADGRQGRFDQTKSDRHWRTEPDVSLGRSKVVGARYGQTELMGWRPNPVDGVPSA